MVGMGVGRGQVKDEWRCEWEVRGNQEIHKEQYLLSKGVHYPMRGRKGGGKENAVGMLTVAS